MKKTNEHNAKQSLVNLVGVVKTTVTDAEKQSNIIENAVKMGFR